MKESVTNKLICLHVVKHLELFFNSHRRYAQKQQTKQKKNKEKKRKVIFRKTNFSLQTIHRKINVSNK